MCRRPPVVEPEPAEKQRGLKGKVVAKKTGEMKDELEAAVALVQRYVPPSPDKMQVVMNAGTASISQAGPGALTIAFPGYEKANDALKITFDVGDHEPPSARRDHVARETRGTGDAAGENAVATGRIELSGQHHAEYSVEQARGPDHEVELPEDRAVARSPVGRALLIPRLSRYSQPLAQARDWSAF